MEDLCFPSIKITSKIKRITMYVSTSVEGYQQKPDLAKITWEVKLLTLNEIAEQLKGGHSLSQNFDITRKTGLFSQSERTKENFKSTNFIFIDLDEIPNEWDDLLCSLRLQPTIAYTTFRHRQTIDGKTYRNRYRLIYFFNEGITTISDYQSYYDALLCQTGIIDILGANDKRAIDSHAKSGVLACHGTNSNNTDFHFINTHRIYNLGDIDLQNGKYYNNIKGREESNIGQLPLCRPPSTKVSKEIINDYDKMSYNLWYNVYRRKHPYIDRIESPEWVEHKWQRISEEYFKLSYITDILKDGHKRRLVLQTRTTLRRVIAPTATPDALFFNILVDFHKFINNDEDVITCKQLVQIVESAFKKSPETIARDYADIIANLQKKNPKCSIILKRGTYKSAAEYNRNLSEVKKEQALGIYDPNITLKENIEIMAANGIRISERTLRNYLGNNKHREAKNAEIEALIDTTMSLTWNSKHLKAEGYSVNWDKLKRLYEEKQKVLS